MKGIIVMYPLDEHDTVRLHAIVHGRVQGVNFRASTRNQAVQLQLTGWVRNKDNGTVELVSEGKRGNSEQFLAYLHEGPQSARVTRVNYTWEAASGEFTSFVIR